MGVLLLVRVTQRTIGHVRCSVFVGPDADHLALSGNLVFRTDEWAHIRDAIAAKWPLGVLLEDAAAPELSRGILQPA